jgi:chitinase
VRRGRRRFAQAFLLVALLALAGLASAAPAAATPRLIGYVADGDAPVALSAGKLDVVNFAFAVVDPNGAVVLQSPTAPARLRELTALRARQPDLHVLLSIGGWGAGHFSEAVRDEAARARFADSAIALLQAHALDGLDIDWEYPTLPGPGISHSPDDRANFAAALALLRTRLDRLAASNGHRRYLLTIAAAEGAFAQGLDLPRLAATLDWINLMSYDFYGSLTPTTGHHAGLRATPGAPAGARDGSAAVAFFLAAGVPASKLNLGAAFYGRRFGDVRPQHAGLLQPFASDGGFISWREIAEQRLDQPGWQRHWDAAAQAPFLWNPDAHAFISYEDPQSLRAKAAFVRARGLGGIMYWEYRQDRDEQLLDVLDQALHAR